MAPSVFEKQPLLRSGMKMSTRFRSGKNPTVLGVLKTSVVIVLCPSSSRSFLVGRQLKRGNADQWRPSSEDQLSGHRGHCGLTDPVVPSADGYRRQLSPPKLNHKQLSDVELRSLTVTETTWTLRILQSM